MARDTCYWTKNGEYLPWQEAPDSNYTDVHTVINYTLYVNNIRAHHDPGPNEGDQFELLDLDGVNNTFRSQNLRIQDQSGDGSSKTSQLTLTVIYCLVPICIVLLVIVTVYMYKGGLLVGILGGRRVGPAPATAGLRFLVADHRGNLVPIGEPPPATAARRAQTALSRIADIEV